MNKEHFTRKVARKENKFKKKKFRKKINNGLYLLPTAAPPPKRQIDC
jgi:hypothetical protein